MVWDLFHGGEVAVARRKCGLNAGEQKGKENEKKNEERKLYVKKKTKPFRRYVI